MNAKELSTLSQELRIWIIDMLVEAKSGHPGGSLSAIDLIAALFFNEMKGIESSGQLLPERDRFILSKGHAVPAFYAVLCKKGFIGYEELRTLRQTGSRLQGHPDRVRLPIMEASTGSLGQGLSVAQGMAMSFKLEGQSSRVYCLVGDGEIQEGQIWEAAMSAAKFELDNLCVILDYNKAQIDGLVKEVMPIEPIRQKWESFGWHVIAIDGHDMAQILAAYQEARELQSRGNKKPVFILAETIKGKGVSFMENQVQWHGTAPKAAEGELARQELRQGLQGGKKHG